MPKYPLITCIAIFGVVGLLFYCWPSERDHPMLSPINSAALEKLYPDYLLATYMASFDKTGCEALLAPTERREESNRASRFDAFGYFSSSEEESNRAGGSGDITNFSSSIDGISQTIAGFLKAHFRSEQFEVRSRRRSELSTTPVVIVRVFEVVKGAERGVIRVTVAELGNRIWISIPDLPFCKPRTPLVGPSLGVDDQAASWSRGR